MQHAIHPNVNTHTYAIFIWKLLRARGRYQGQGRVVTHTHTDICIFYWFLNTEIMQVVEILPCRTQWTRTTRTPSFWGYPPPHPPTATLPPPPHPPPPTPHPPPPHPPPPQDYPYYWVILDPKSKGDKVKVTNLKNLPKLKIFETNFTCDTPSEVAS